MSKVSISAHGDQAPETPNDHKPACIDIQAEVIKSGIRRQVLRLHGPIADAVLMELARRAGRYPDKPNFRSCYPAQRRIATDIGREKSRPRVNTAIRKLDAAGIITSWPQPNPGKKGTRTHYRIAETSDLETIARRLQTQEKADADREHPATTADRLKQAKADQEPFESPPRDTKQEPFESPPRDTKQEPFESPPRDTPLSPPRNTCKINKNLQEGGREDLNPSIPEVSAETDLNQTMLTHPEISMKPETAAAIANQHTPRLIFDMCCQYVRDRDKGHVHSAGALVARFKHPNDFPAPPASETPGSHFYHAFCHQVNAIERANHHPQPQADEQIATPEPPDTAPRPAPTPERQLREAIYAQQVIIKDPKSTHPEIDAAKDEIRRLTGRKRPGPTPNGDGGAGTATLPLALAAAGRAAEPATDEAQRPPSRKDEQKARLQAIMNEIEPPAEYNRRKAIIENGVRRIEAHEMPGPERDEKVYQWIERVIETLTDEPAPANRPDLQTENDTPAKEAGSDAREGAQTDTAPPPFIPPTAQPGHEHGPGIHHAPHK